MRNHRLAVALLDFGGQVSLSDPANSETEFIGELDLVEETSEHLPLGGSVTGGIRCLGD
jgi:hypothetical protein